MTAIRYIYKKWFNKVIFLKEMWPWLLWHGLWYLLYQAAAINYIAKGEKVGNELNALYKSVIGHPSEDDNPTTNCVH